MPLVNHGILKPETEKAVGKAGRLVHETVDRWLGGWPAATRKLEEQGLLVTEAKKAVNREDKARMYTYSHPEVSMSEALELFDMPLYPPTKRPRLKTKV